MRTPAEALVAASLRDIRPRDGFEAELFAGLARQAHLPHAVPIDPTRDSRWIVATAVAGAASVSGLVYLAARRRRRMAA